MNTNAYGEVIFESNSLFNELMKDSNITKCYVTGLTDKEANAINELDVPINVTHYVDSNISIKEFDIQQQSNWYMPNNYKALDIAEYILSLCDTQEELQRCGIELLLYQERNLFDLLRYMKYLVDTMEENNIIWGVGRGSSVASYVLYKLKVHSVDSMYYNLDVTEFLR